MTPSRRSRSRKSRIAPGSQRIPRLVFANYSQEDVAELIARYKAAALQPQPSAPVVDADLAVDNDSRPVSPANHRQPARFWISSPKSPARFPSNKITTSKYTLLTFLPKNLFEQFRRVANLFFLTVAILQFFPDYQVIDPVVAALPFIFIIAITALKDAIEDLRRHQSDERMNGLPVRVARSPEWFNSNQPFFEEPPQHWATSRNKQKQRRTECTTEPPHDLDPRWVEISWGNVQIGDIVLIQNDDPIPADLIILSSSEPDCLCYVETKNLDGETNLKIRQGLEETAFLSRGDIRMLFEEGTSRTRRFGERMEETTDDEKPRRLFRVAIEMEDPNPSLYTFSGAVLVSWDSLEWMKKQARRNTDQAVTDFDGTKPENNRDLVSVKIPLGINEMLLRGCILRNTDWVIGLVVYAGPEAKICLNSDKTPSKQSRIDIQMNPQVMTNLFILFLMCFFNALLSFVWENRQLPPLRDKFVPWLESSYPAASISRSNIGYAVFVSFWSSVLAYQNIVPISLYITVELVKSLQAYFIFSDLNMYHDETDQPCLPRSWNLADDLGQIDYIFSDKTGTLTQNIMQFKKCSINGTIYGIGVHYANAAHERESAMKMSQDLEKPIDMRVSEARSFATVVGGSRRSLGVTSLTEIALRKSTRESRPLVVEGTVDRQSEKRDFHNRQDKHRATWSEWNFGPWRYKKKSGVAEFRAEATLFGKPKVTENKIEKKSEATSSPPLSGSHAHHCAEDLQFSDPLLTNRLGDPTSDHYTALRDFFTCLSVCHSVLVSESPVDGGLRYMAQSPDEAALVQAARDVGISFVKRGPGSMTVDALGEIEESALLNVLEFNSTRKRMSIIVRRPAGEIVLYCKGADNVIYNLLASGQEAMKEITAGHLEQFAEEGLRTLCIAYAVLSEEKYTKWAAKYHEASTAITDRASKMDEAAQEIEENLVLIGATAIEDKLQEGVPQCIAHLLQAQIKIWVLTGDKMETAINIGFSCNLLAKDMILILIRGFEPGSTNDTGPADITCQQIREALKRFFGPDDDSQMSCGRRSRNDDSGHPENAPLKPPDSRKYALVIEGSALEQALQPDNRDIFLELGTRCSAVICCRVSPLQKARVVDLVRARKEAMCLAIGDGANDVSMIQAAQIGVGIAGEEGLQAVMASDYAIGQFRFLERLLLIHGHWSFVRTSEMILNFFFKNIIWVLILYWFQFYCGFSSEMIYEVSYMILYNVLFTALPVAVIGVLDQDVDEFRLAAAPQLLKSVQAAKPFSFFRFGMYTGYAVYQSLVTFFAVFFIFYEGPLDLTGRAADKNDFAVTLAICTILNADIFVTVSVHSWNVLGASIVGASIAIVFIYSSFYSALPLSLVFGVGNTLFGRPVFWLTLLLQMTICHLPRITSLYIQRAFRPTDTQLIQEIQKLQQRVHVSTEDNPLSDDFSTKRSPTRSQFEFANGNTQGGTLPALKSRLVASNSSVDRDTVDSHSRQSTSHATPAVPTLKTSVRFSNRDLKALSQRASVEPTRARSAQSEPDLSGTVRWESSQADQPEDDSELEGARANRTYGSLYSMTATIRTPATPMLSGSNGVPDTLAPGETALLTMMTTGEVIRNRGYSFSQSQGARDILMGRASGTGTDAKNSQWVSARGDNLGSTSSRREAGWREENSMLRTNTDPCK